MNLFPLKPASLALLLLLQAAPHASSAPTHHFRYSRAIKLSVASTSGQACAVLDADVFAHAAPSLKDLRLYSGQTELPYAITVSEPQQQESDDARIFNFSAKSGHVAFDLEMPHRPYTLFNLDLAAHDYIAKATVSGSAGPYNKIATQLGTFTLFDLTSQHLSHSTSIPLSESIFPYLHIDLALIPAPGSSSSAASLNVPATVKAAIVPPSREAQTLYVITQRHGEMLNVENESIATFKVRARVPIERIAFTLPPGYKGNFSRDVKIEAHGMTEEGANTQEELDKTTGDGAPFHFEDATGNIFHVHKSEAGRDLSAQALSIPVSIGSNMQQPAAIAVTIENGSDSPLPIASVELQMRQRRICFETVAGPLTLYYGDPSLDAPEYDDAKLSQAACNPRIAQLEPETRNAEFSPALPPQKLAHQHPILRWIALLGCVCIFALLVIRRSADRRHH